MKVIYIKILICAMKVFFYGLCSGQSICKDVSDEVFKGTSQKNVDSTIYAKGKVVIPCLIDLIDLNKKGAMGYQNINSSSIHSFTLNNYLGIRAAYLIDMICSSDYIRDASKRRYNYGVIVKLDTNGDEIMEPLSYKDMIQIQKKYLKWWKKNKDNPLSIIRDNRESILGKGYKWI